MSNKIILHSDCNSFYASVECHKNPKLRNLPVAVSGNTEDRHGIILAKNDIAKKFGVSTGEAIWQAQKKCPNLVNIKPDFKSYIEYSNKIRDIYNQYTDLVEPFGLDEAWLDITSSRKVFGNGVNIAKEIKERIKNEVGVTVSIGLSYNKIFAKLASDYKKPDALTIISPRNYKSVVWPLDCRDLFYVGSATSKKLAGLGIYTIGDIANMDKTLLNKCFGKWGYRLYSFANGLDTSPVALNSYIREPKSIGNSTTTHRDLTTLDDIKIILQVLTDSVCRRLREQGLFSKTVSIQIRNKKLQTINRQQTLISATNLTSNIFDVSLKLFKENYNINADNGVRSLSVSLSDLTHNNHGIQLSIFDTTESIQNKKTRLEKLDVTCDKIKNRFGNYSVVNASLLKDKKLSKFNPKEDHIIHPIGFSCN